MVAVNFGDQPVRARRDGELVLEARPGDTAHRQTVPPHGGWITPSLDLAHASVSRGGARRRDSLWCCAGAMRAQAPSLVAKAHRCRDVDLALRRLGRRRRAAAALAVGRLEAEDAKHAGYVLEAPGVSWIEQWRRGCGRDGS